MTILKELFSVLNEKKVEDDQYFVTCGTGKKFDLHTEKAFKSVEAAQKYIDREMKMCDDTDDGDAGREELENCEIMSGKELKKKYPKLFEAVRAGYQSTVGAERQTDDPWADEKQEGDDKKVIVRPKTQGQRDRLAATVKNARANARDVNNRDKKPTLGAKSARDDAEIYTGRKAAAVTDKNVHWQGGADRNAGRGVHEAKDDDDCVSRQCHAQAAAKSKKDGVVQHINKDKRTGKLYVSDWFDDDETVATYNKGKLSEGVVKTVKRALSGWNKPGSFGDRSIGGDESPAGLVKKNKGYDDKTLDLLKGQPGEKPAKGSPRALQVKVIDRELKKRQVSEARSIPSWFQDGAKVKLMPEYADKDPNEVFTLKSVDTETGKGRIADDQGKGWGISYYQVYPKNKTPAIHEGYGMGDAGKRAFKRAELQQELGHEDRAEGNRTFSYSKPRTEFGSFGIEIDGKLWKREGTPVKFGTKGAAEKAVLNSRAMSGKNTKVVPLDEDAALQGLGKSLSGKAPAEPEADVDVPMDDGEVKSTGPSDTEVTGDADDQQTSAEFKVGDVVKTLIGPHKGEQHDVVKVHSDGRIDLKPKGIEGTAVKYRNGGITAKPEQVVLAESIIRPAKSLLRTVVIDLSEARGDGMMPLSYKPAKGHKIEAYGRKGMKNTMWRKYFKDGDAMAKWCEDNDATVEGSRDLDKDELR